MEVALQFGLSIRFLNSFLSDYAITDKAYADYEGFTNKHMNRFVN